MSGDAERSPAVQEAAAALYGVPHREFTAERKRRATELRRAGDRTAAAAVEKLPRPGLSAWAVNQLWRVERGAFDRLLAAGARMRAGDLAAAADQRAALAELRGRAAELLVTDGHAASEPTLRRITTTLQALSASGTFEPDPPGQLAGDRDPPGFEVFAGVELDVSPPPAPEPPAAAAGIRPDAGDADREAARERERARRERDRAAREREAARRAATRELSRLELAAERARRTAEQRARELDALRAEVAAAERAQAAALEAADAADREVAAARERLDQLAPPDRDADD